MKWKILFKKNIVILLLFGCFNLFVVNTFYLYSIRSDYVPWGSALTDGLFFLAFFIWVLPSMILLSVLKLFIKKQDLIFRFSYFFYSFLVAVPAIGDAYSQSKLLWGMGLCIFVFLLNIFEYICLFRRLEVIKES